MKNSHNTDNDFLQHNFELFFEQSLAGFLIAGPQNSILRSNSRLAAWLGTTAEALKGKQFSDLLSIGSKIYYETHLGPLLRMQGFFDEVLVELDAAGQRLKVLVNAVVHKDENNTTQSIYYTITKATDRIQYEQNLQYAKTIAEKELEAAQQNIILREQLIGVLGHDLRNPLGAISMAVTLMQDSLLNTGNIEILAILKRSSHRMTELIANIMDFARTRLGEGIVINPQEVILAPVIQQVIEELKLIFRNREIISVFNISEPVRCDPDRIAQLLSNLLANALSHGYPATPVYVYATHVNKVLEISVMNNGDPIPMSLRGLLFAPFTREGNRPSKNGLGLGLYIASEIAKAHNATLSFTSTTAETRFIFSMPS